MSSLMQVGVFEIRKKDAENELMSLLAHQMDPDPVEFPGQWYEIKLKAGC